MSGNDELGHDAQLGHAHKAVPGHPVALLTAERRLHAGVPRVHPSPGTHESTGAAAPELIAKTDHSLAPVGRLMQAAAAQHRFFAGDDLRHLEFRVEHGRAAAVLADFEVAGAESVNGGQDLGLRRHSAAVARGGAVEDG